MQKNFNANEEEIKWFDQSTNSVLDKLQSSETGLKQSEAERRLNLYGPNCLPEAPRQSPLKRILRQFHNILIYVLLVSAIITALLEHTMDTVVILAVVIINAIIGFIQEGKAEKAMDAIRQMLAPHASVLRDGERKTVAGEILVPGDIVILEAGDKVPADLRLLHKHGLYLQESILTGESVPVEKHTNPVSANASLGDRSNMAFSGTLVTAGQGKGVVVATAHNTEIGRITGLLSNIEVLTTPLLEQISTFSKWLTFIILVVAASLITFGYFVQHHSFSEIFMAVVGLSVAAIPEGLPAVMTITLAIGVKAMARQNAIIRRLPSIETLGSVSVICTDKTGTLTFNEMMVKSALTPNHSFAIEGQGYSPQGIIKLDNKEIKPNEYPDLNDLARAATICNDAGLKKSDDIWTVEGDPMEGALLAFANKAGIELKKTCSNWARTDTIAFDSKHRFMATLNHNHQQHAFIFVKGAPERIIEMCDSTQSIDKEYWHKRAEEIASQGQRVLAFAIKAVEPEHTILEHSDIEGKLTLLGMVGMIDPPRPEAIRAITECNTAGIRVKMITGDHSKTAAAIATQIGIENPNIVLTGSDIDAMDDKTLKDSVLKTDIYARTSPEHKLRLVMAIQSHGMTVAMTGDGVNDAPALKRADAGIAMGKKGSEAAKEASDFVLADDNFASIVAAIREGRTVYDNIKKVISWTLPTSTGEAITIIAALLLGMTLPVSPIQILWVNLITASTLGIALAFEPTEPNIMLRPPRTKQAPLLSGELAWHIVLVSILFLCGVFGIYSYALNKGYSLELARTLSLNTLVIMEIFHLFFIRNINSTFISWKIFRGTKIVWLTVFITVIAQLLITYVPLLQNIFNTESVPFFDGLIVLGIGFLLFVTIETEKQLRLRIKS